MDAAVAGAVGEGAAQCGSNHLLGGALAVVTRRRAVDDATTGHVRSADRTLTGAAGALLLERLAACTGNLGAGLGLVRTLARSGELGDDDLVQQRHVGLNVEDLCGQVNLAQCRVAIELGSLHGGAYEYDLAAGAGNGALDQQQRLLDVNRVDREVQRGVTHGAHAAGHAHALEDAARGGGATDGTGLAVVACGHRGRRRHRGSRDAS